MEGWKSGTKTAGRDGGYGVGAMRSIRVGLSKVSYFLCIIFTRQIKEDLIMLGNDIVVDGDAIFKVSPFLTGPNVENTGRRMFCLDQSNTGGSFSFLYKLGIGGGV